MRESFVQCLQSEFFNNQLQGPIIDRGRRKIAVRNKGLKRDTWVRARLSGLRVVTLGGGKVNFQVE